MLCRVSPVVRRRSRPRGWRAIWPWLRERPSRMVLVGGAALVALFVIWTGWTAYSTADDLSLRVSEAGDGPEAVRQTLLFAQALSEATAATASSAR